MADTSVHPPSGSYGPGLLRSAWRYRVPVIVATLLVAVSAFLLSNLIPPTYVSSATVVLADTAAFGDEVMDPERQVQQEANRLLSRAVLDDVARQLNDDVSGDELRRSISVEADAIVGAITVTATDDTARGAAETANTVVSSYEVASLEATQAHVASATEVLSKQSADIQEQIADLRSSSAGDAAAAQRLEALQTQLITLETRMSEIAADAAVYGAGIEGIERAVPPSEPTSPNPMRNAVVAAVAAFAVACALAYWRAGVVDDEASDPALILGAPLLARIPQFTRGSGRSGSDPLFDFEAAEAYQFLLASFEYAIAQTHARSILVTSASPGDGKSLTALHLARALAIQGRNVMLVDSDIRARGLTSLLKADDEPGLVGLAGGEDPHNVVRRYRISPQVQLPFVPAGRPQQQPTGLLATDKYRDAITKISTASELTIIDGGPLLTVADASAVAMQVSGILLVLSAKTPESDLRKVQQRLRLIPTPLLGYLVNRVPEREIDTSYGKPMANLSRRWPLFGRLRPYGDGREPPPENGGLATG